MSTCSEGYTTRLQLPHWAERSDIYVHFHTTPQCRTWQALPFFCPKGQVREQGASRQDLDDSEF